MSKSSIDIPATSYVNKDFGSMYPEILDVAKQLTNKWDPSQSNESDPGVVLLKEAAFVADHNNYNIDKNVLENFLPTATQDISVRNICEMNGYVPDYYKSATGKVTFTFEDTSDEASTESFTVPAFTMIVTDSDSSVSYTQVEDLIINFDSTSTKSISSSCNFMEGTLNTLTVNDSNTITVNNLDDNNRIYFPVTNIAQNGVYVRYSNDSDFGEYGFWTRDNYLSTNSLGSRVYKVGYDSNQLLPYIEFPEDIADIILDGLLIIYITTTGASGNVSAGTLTNILSPSEYEKCVSVSGEYVTKSFQYFTLSNSGNIANGKDPETVDEMYDSFKKVVGTFDSLISLNDYDNKIFTMVDGSDDPLISNVYVTDRRNDYNKAINVATMDEIGKYFKNISIGDKVRLTYKGNLPDNPTSNIGDVYTNTSGGSSNFWICVNSTGTFSKDFVKTPYIDLKDFSGLSGGLTPYELCIHALKKYSAADYSIAYPAKALDSSFTATSKGVLQEIEDGLEENKCICHQFKSNSDSDVFCFKNYVPLNITIIPYNKVGYSETVSILNNIYKALSDSFNAREVEFGKSLDKDSIEETILDCDSRIRKVEIQAINYDAKVLLSDNTVKELGSEYKEVDGVHYTYLSDLLAKNVLAGRLCLFDFDDRFSRDFGYKDCVEEDLVKSGDAKNLSTYCKIKLIGGTSTNSSTSTGTTNTTTVSSTGEVTVQITANFVNIGTSTTKLQENGSYTLKNVGTKVDELVVTYGKLVGSLFTPTSSITYKSNSSHTITVVNDSVSADRFPVKGTSSILSSGESFTITDVSISSSTSDLPIVLNNYELLENEVVQIIYPNYYSKTTYGVYVYYRWDGTKTLKANTENFIINDEHLYIWYNEDGVNRQECYGAGSIIKPSFDIKTTSSTSSLLSGSVKKTYTDYLGQTQEGVFCMLSSGQTISSQALMETVLKNSGYKCYWIMNNSDNRLFKTGSLTTILESGEYFIYADKDLTEIMILGEGTKLVRKSSLNDSWWVIGKDVEISEITSSGTSTTIPWKTMDFSGTDQENKPYQLSIIEMSVVSLGSGDKISINSNITGDKYIESSWKSLNDELGLWSIAINNEASYSSDDSRDYWIRSRLDLAVTGDNPQVLKVGKDDAGNEVCLETIKIDENSYTKCNVKSSYDLYINGGDNIDLSYFSENYIDISLLFYNITNSSDKKFTISKNVGTYAGEYKYMSYPIFLNKNVDTIMPVYVDGSEVPSLKAEIKNDLGDLIDIKDYNFSGEANYISMSGDQLYNICPKSIDSDGMYTLYISWLDSESNTTNPETVTVGDFKIITGQNSLISSNSSLYELVLKNMKYILSGSDSPSTKFIYTYEPENSMAIDLEKYITSTGKAFDGSEVFWDKNNVANHLTIPQLDLNNSSITIEKSMRDY